MQIVPNAIDNSFDNYKKTKNNLIFDSYPFEEIIQYDKSKKDISPNYEFSNNINNEKLHIDFYNNFMEQPKQINIKKTPFVNFLF